MAEDRTPLLGGSWSIFTQPDGPNTAPEYLGCHDFGDMDKDDGDITLLYCPSPEKANKWDVVGSYQGESSPATFELTTTIKKQRDVLDRIKCGVPFYVLNISCGRKDVFNNWDDNAIIPYPATRTTRSWQNLAKRVPGDQNESMKVYGFSANEVYEVWGAEIGRQAIAETTGLNDIAFCNSEKCADNCGQAAELGQNGFTAGDSPAGSPLDDADVWYTDDSSQTWDTGNPSPFADGVDVAAIECFPIDKDTTRYLVAKGTAGAGPMQVAYRDGQTGAWTVVTVGTVNGQYALGPQALFVLDSQHIWLVVNSGYIYFSDDGGVTWSTQSAGIVTAQNLHAVHGSDANNLFVTGATDTVLRTTDGGGAWTAMTATGGGGINQRLWVISKDKVWIGDSTGSLYYTTDGGTTWVERVGWTGANSGQIRGVAFANDLVGYMLHNTAAPVGTVFQTINGGYSWRALQTPTNSGLNALIVLDSNLAYAVGEAQGGTGVILKISVA